MFRFLSAVADSTTTPETEEVVSNPTLLDKVFSFDWGLPEFLQNFVNKCIEVVVIFIVLVILCKIVDIITKKFCNGFLIHIRDV